MSTPETSPSSDAFVFAAKYHLPIIPDLEGEARSGWCPRLSVADELITKAENIKYHFSRLDYVIGEDNVQANRLIARIPAGHRTELNYWTAEAPDKPLTFHQGAGRLLLAHMSGKSGCDFRILTLDVKYFDAKSHPEREVVVPSSSFYVIQSATNTNEALVVSGFYQPPIASLEGLEIEIGPGQEMVSAPEGDITVPSLLNEMLEQQ